MALVEIILNFLSRNGGASGLDSHTYFSRLFFQLFNAFPGCEWFKVSLALLLSNTYQRKALKVRNTDIQVQNRL